MLKALKRSAGNAIKAAGYSISRPTEIEKGFLRSPWGHLLSRDPARFAAAYLKNRETLKLVDQWVSPVDLQSSLWRYGVPEEWDASYLNHMTKSGLADIDLDITAADVLTFLAGDVPDLRYLEIGVSVGKTFLQMCRQFPTAQMTGLDVEAINPALLKFFPEPTTVWSDAQTYPVDTLSGRPFDKRASMISLGDNVRYLSADQFRHETWEQLAGSKFNFVFSDGVHTPEALRAELRFLIDCDLIDRERFVMFWDDLWGEPMQSAFMDNATCLCDVFGCGTESISLYTLHGSYGNQRPMGLFSTPHS